MTSRGSLPVERPPYLTAALVSASILLLYVATIAPTTQFWDASEYIAAAKVLGIPHPPGNPLFVLLANVWGRLPLVEHYALRINLFAAITSALASGFLFLVADRFLRDLIVDRLPRRAAAAAGILVGATAFTVWNQSVVNEKVYTLSLLSIALLLWLGTVWADRSKERGGDNLLLAILYLLALSSTNHSMGLLVGTAIIVLGVQVYRAEGGDSAEWAKLLLVTTLLAGLVFLPDVLRNGAESPMYYGMAALVLAVPIAAAAYTGQWRFALGAVAVVAVGLSLNAFLPLRAAMYPAINEGEPTTWTALRDVLTREQYQKGPLMPRQADLAWQYINYLQYFSWQFGRDWAPAVRRVLAVLFGGLGLLGAVWHWRRDKIRAAAMTALMVTVTVLLVFYLDFKYGYSIRPGETLLREVRERDYFFVASFQLWGVWVALGFAAILSWAARYTRDRHPDLVRWAPGAPVLALCAIPLVGNWLSASRAGETLPRDAAWDLMQSVEPNAILITAGDNDTFPLWYIQEVEGVRQDVVVANLSLMNTLWHARQLKRRTPEPFDVTSAIPLYRDRQWPTPTDPVLSLSYGALDSLPLVYRVPPGQVFQVGDLRVDLPEILERADVVTLGLIQDNIGKRPIYVSRTTGNYGERLGLAPYLLGHGMVRKLLPEPVQASENVVSVGPLGWIDVERTERLLFEVYHVESAARDRALGWLDDPSENILTLYGVVYTAYAEILRQTPDSVLAGSGTTRASRMQQAADWADAIFRQAGF